MTKQLGLAGRRALLALGGAIGVAASAPAAPPPAASWSARYRAVKTRDGAEIGLALYRRRAEAPAAGAPARPVLFLVHGSSAASEATFDLHVPGEGAPYSLMDVFSAAGFDVWTMDHEGYGRSDRTEGNADIASGVEDLRAAAAVVMRDTGVARMHMMGESSGALRVAAFAAAEPARVGRLVLVAFTYTGAGSPTLGKRAEQVAFYRTHNRRPRDRAMLLSIFTRDRPGTTDPAVATAFADTEMAYGYSVPSGTYLDMTAHLPVVQPADVKAPVLLVRGEYDGIATMEDLLAFFAALPNADRQFAVIAGAAHSVTFSVMRQAFWHVMGAFLTMPAEA
jgi:alpha-beta hydrolase superfamily lysophospholipase